MIHAWPDSTEAGKLGFGREGLMMPDRMRKPLAERILLRCPRLASALVAVGARSAPRPVRAESGSLAAMMTASGSIDYVGRGRKNFRFHIRPMA